MNDFWNDKYTSLINHGINLYDNFNKKPIINNLMDLNKPNINKTKKDRKIIKSIVNVKSINIINNIYNTEIDDKPTIKKHDKIINLSLCTSTNKKIKKFPYNIKISKNKSNSYLNNYEKDKTYEITKFDFNYIKLDNITDTKNITNNNNQNFKLSKAENKCNKHIYKEFVYDDNNSNYKNKFNSEFLKLNSSSNNNNTYFKQYTKSKSTDKFFMPENKHFNNTNNLVKNNNFFSKTNYNAKDLEKSYEYTLLLLKNRLINFADSTNANKLFIKNNTNAIKKCYFKRKVNYSEIKMQVKNTISRFIELNPERKKYLNNSNIINKTKSCSKLFSMYKKYKL